MPCDAPVTTATLSSSFMSMPTTLAAPGTRLLAGIGWRVLAGIGRWAAGVTEPTATTNRAPERETTTVDR